MNKTYICISITYYNCNGLAPSIHYYYNDGVHPAISTFDELSAAEANHKMWELVKMGGKNTYTANMFNNTISYREVTFWGFL